MQSSQTPKLMPLAFAATGGRNAIPEASQLPGSPGAASYTDGFPPATRTAIVAGGIPPAGLDMNGILYEVTASLRWAHAGGRYTWNSAFTTDTNVAGYPNGATLMRADLTGFWINTADNNETNPDATDGSAANWVPGYNYGVTPITGLTNANVTLTPAQAAKNKITLAGTLTGNVQIIFPAWTKEWEVVNNTTGAFTITAKTAAGTGIALAAGQQKITGDGTNITQPAESIAAATQNQHAMQYGQATGRLIGIQHFVASTTYFPTPGTTSIEVEIVGGGAAGGSTNATGAGQVAIGGGGGAGGYARSRYTSGFSGVAITIGAGGTAASPAGGTTSFGALMSATGGTQGASGVNTVAAPPFSAIGGLGGVGSSGNIVNAQGGQGIVGIAAAAASFVSGAGGQSAFGMGGGAQGTTSNTGSAAPSAGGGGGGALAGASTAAQNGGAGAAGVCIIREYS